MINYQAAADFRAGMDFDAGFFPGVLGDPAGQKEMLPLVKPVGDAMPDHGMNAGIKEKDLQFAAGGGVAPLVGGQQAAQTGDAFCHMEKPPKKKQAAKNQARSGERSYS
jgi:hypothetical protein